MNRVFHFNPSCELEVANRIPFFSPPKQVQNVGLDGAQLPVFFIQSGDRVLVKHLPSCNFIKTLHEFNIQSDVFLPIDKVNEINSHAFLMSPWGWSPTQANHFEKWFPNSPNNFVWKQEYEHWYRRETAANVLDQLIQSNPKYTNNLLPKVYTNVLMVDEFLSDWGALVMKAPLSSSGRGVQFLRKQPLNASNKQWIQGVVDQQGNVMVERMWDKVFDFSFHFYKNTDGEISFVGETAFICNTNGKYKGSYIGDVYSAPNFPPEMNVAELESAKKDLMHVLKIHENYHNYSGFLGVDMMIYREEGMLKLHPCVEINARQSMGLVAIHLKKWIKTGVKAMFLVELKKDIDPNNFTMDKEAGKISRCYWPLSDYWKANQFVFILKVGEEV